MKRFIIKICVTLCLCVLVANSIAAPHDAAPSPGDERKPTQTVCAAYRSPMPWGFTAGKDKINIICSPLGGYSLLPESEFQISYINSDGSVN